MDALYRSRDERMVSGLAAGVARVVRVDAVIVRLLFVLLALASGIGLVLYVLGTLLVREEGSPATGLWGVVRENAVHLRYDALTAWQTLVEWVREGRERWSEAESDTQRQRSLIAGSLVIGGAFLFLWSAGLFWWLGWWRFVALALVIVGVALLRTLRK